MRSRISRLLVACTVLGGLMAVGEPANATPVCTDGYKGGLPLTACGGRIFPDATNGLEYVQYLPDPQTGFREFQYGIEYLAVKYPRWVSVFNLRDLYGDDAVSMGPDRIRSYMPNDTGDGYDIWVVRLTDHEAPDEGKEKMVFSLSVHGDEIGGREGGLRAIEDLAMAAEDGGTIADGVEGYESTTGEQPEINSYEVKDVLAKEDVYFIDFNVDGWTRGDHFTRTGSPNTGLYTRGNWAGTDLNRQVPTVGWTNSSRNPLAESEMLYGHKFMHEIAAAGVGGKLAYGADIHGESGSRAFVDIMYPAGQFDSIKHRRLMAIAERTKSVIDATLYEGVANMAEEETGGDAGEGIEDSCVTRPAAGPVTGATQCPPKNSIPTKPARWGTVWDTLSYTDTGFIGDYLATELGVTGMDYEIFHNHADQSRPHGRPWSVVLQENYFNASRAIIKTAMAYAMTEREDFADFKIETGGQVGYVFDPQRVTNADDNGIGRLPGPDGDGLGANDLSVEQKPYSASHLDFFEDESAYIEGGFQKVNPATIAGDASALDHLDSLVIADMIVPGDESGASYDEGAYFSNLRSWVEKGGNLVLTDRALHALERMNVVPEGSVSDIGVYMPYANIVDLEHPMVEGLRGNARQLAEFTLIGYPEDENTNAATPMTIVNRAAWEAAGGHTVGTTGNGAGSSDDGSRASVGEATLELGKIRIMGGGLAWPTENYDHRFGLKDYALTYSGLYILENSIKHDAPNLGPVVVEDTWGLFGLL